MYYRWHLAASIPPFPICFHYLSFYFKADEGLQRIQNMSDTISTFKITEYEVKKYAVFVELLKVYSDI